MIYALYKSSVAGITLKKNGTVARGRLSPAARRTPCCWEASELKKTQGMSVKLEMREL